MIKYINYIDRNKFGQECLIVTAINAYMYLTGDIIKQDSKRYDALVRLGSTDLLGTANKIHKVWKKLGIYPEIYSKHLLHPDLFTASYALPMEVSVCTKYGLHSVCVVEYERNTHSFRIPNWRWYTSTMGWVFIEDLEQYVVNKEGWKCRIFKLIQ